MSSYHTSFTYLNKNSSGEGLMIASFEPDSGFVDAYLNMDQIYDESYDGTKNNLYGSRYNTKATISITVVKRDGTEFSVADNRRILRWLTGSRKASWLDFYESDNLAYSFLGNVISAQQQKLDAKVIGIKIEFASLHPWAYSAPQKFDCYIGEAMLHVDENGVLYKGGDNSSFLGIDKNGVAFNDKSNSSVIFDSTDAGIVYNDARFNLKIDNQTDDLYSYIYLDIEYNNKNSNELTITNLTLGETSEITELGENETIKLSGNQFIVSDIPNKIFGDTFNFVWPRLCPGINDIEIYNTRQGDVHFIYRYPIKIGDCAVDIDGLANNPSCEGEISGAVGSVDGITKVGRKNVIMIDRHNGASYTVCMHDGKLTFSETTSTRNQYSFALEDTGDDGIANEINFINNRLYITTIITENIAETIHDYIVLVDEVTSIPYKIMVENNGLYFVEL